MTSVAVTNTLVAGTTASASDVTQNFTDLVSWLNLRNAATTKWDALSVLGVATFSDGTAGAPSMAFSSDGTVGVYKSGGGQISIATAGTARLNLSTVAISATLPFFQQGGTAGAPVYSFSSNQTTGIYASASATIGFAAGGTLCASISGAALTSVVQLIAKGTATNDSAASGYIGEYIEATSTASTNVGTTGAYADYVSISLTAGDWDVTGLMRHINNGSTETTVFTALSAYSANTTTDHVVGTNIISCTPPNGNSGMSIVIPVWRVSITGTATYYLKGAANYSAGTPQMSGGRISARRVR